MAQMDGNPIIWGVDQLAMLMRYIGGRSQRVGGGDSAATTHLPEIRRVTTHDLREIVAKGIDDFAACRSDVAFLCVFYPIIGVVLAWIAFDRNLLPLLFPVISGFALIGPLAAVGLYEMSRRRELRRGDPLVERLQRGEIAVVPGDHRARGDAVRHLPGLDSYGERHLLRDAWGRRRRSRSAPFSGTSSPPAPAGR